MGGHQVVGGLYLTVVGLGVFGLHGLLVCLGSLCLVAPSFQGAGAVETDSGPLLVYVFIAHAGQLTALFEQTVHTCCPCVGFVIMRGLKIGIDNGHYAYDGAGMAVNVATCFRRIPVLLPSLGEFVCCIVGPAQLQLATANECE